MIAPRALPGLPLPTSANMCKANADQFRPSRILRRIDQGADATCRHVFFGNNLQASAFGSIEAAAST
jgi:hypothetical protein